MALYSSVSSSRLHQYYVFDPCLEITNSITKMRTGTICKHMGEFQLWTSEILTKSDLNITLQCAFKKNQRHKSGIDDTLNVLNNNMTPRRQCQIIL